MRTETEMNIDGTECRFLVYQGDTLVDAYPWRTLRPYRFVTPMHPLQRALFFPLSLLAVEVLVLLMAKLVH